MANLLKSNGILREGEVFNKIMDNRFKQNQNILTAITGGTGSSKSYQDLRRAELWYSFYFNKPFPSENICFSLATAMRRLTSGELKKGDILIMEESGVNLGSLDFQQKIVKLFNYVLQSFRSLNIGIFFNLPHLSMLSKQARMLIHYHFITQGIDHEKKIAKSKCFYRQVNQQTGKVYPKYLRYRVQGKITTIKKLSYSLPSPELMERYEAEKLKFISGLTEEFVQHLNKLDYEAVAKDRRNVLTEKQKQVYDLLLNGYTQTQIGDIMNITQQAVSVSMKAVIKKGYKLQIDQKPLGKQDIQVSDPIPIPI